MDMLSKPEAPINYDWKPGDDPTTHPLWEEQVKAEYGMLRAGADKVRDRVITARSKERMTDLKVVRGLAADWVPGVADTIREWIRSAEKRRGPSPVALPLVKKLDPYVAAMVGVRAILDHISKETYTLVNVAMTIGHTLEHEEKIRLWEAKEPALFYDLKKDMDTKKVTSDHRRRTHVNLFHKHLEGGTFESITWQNWTQDEKFRVGWTILDCVVKKTGWFEIIPDPDHTGGHNNRPKLAITVKEGLSNWLQKALDHEEATSPAFKPTLMPPKRWEGTRDGGYWTPYVNAPRLIRFKASQEHQKARAADEYDSMDMPQVYRALNLLQETAWCVNQKVLDVVREVWEEKGALIKGMPETQDRELPPRSPRMIEHKEQVGLAKALGQPVPPTSEKLEEEIKAWKKLASPIYSFNAKRVAKMRLTTDMLKIAKEYSCHDEFYFPHMLDFRGRMYPIPAFLQPQGNDLARGLLTFATSAPITEANGGVRWLAIHLASNWGHDKWPYDKRVAWVYDNEALLRSIAADPNANRQWCSADKPWQALAAVFEWVSYLDHGDGYESSLPVMVDGTCNGIQHLSALTRDKVAGSYVNLVPGDEPQDIYKFVARNLQAELEDLVRVGGIDADHAQWWLELTDYDLPRTLTKRQVMVLPYGGTRDSFFGYTRAWLKEYHPKLLEGLTDEDKDELKDRIVFMSSRMWGTVNSVVYGGMKVMEWLQKVAKQAAIANQPIYWKVPSGFVVRQFYGLNREKQVDLLLDGTRMQIVVAERTAKLSVREQLQGVSPNFIHSLDASCLCDCCNASLDVGITAFASVHDAYGTHAANMNVLADLLRQSFVAVHQHDLLGSFKKAAVTVIEDVLIVEKGVDPLDAFQKAEDLIDASAGRLEMGDLELTDILKSDYFFA